MGTNPNITPLETGRQVVHQEAKALLLLADNLDATFVRCVELLLNVQGRIAVTGMGKSGHIARKIAATLASTGSPAYYIHPAEASHGDLGMMSKNDVLIALSNSGNTPELYDILHYAARYGIPIMAITGRADSKLGRIADYCLELPRVEEACPLVCAPTTSTTLELAIGDALAMAILQLRGFTLEEFCKYHPGGVLGKQLRTVEEVMRTGDDIPLVKEQTSMSEVICIMTGKGFGCAGVVSEEGTLVGIITDGDIRRHLHADLLQSRADRIMTRTPCTITKDYFVCKTISFMELHKITSVFIIDKFPRGKPIGIINMHMAIMHGSI